MHSEDQSPWAQTGLTHFARTLVNEVRDVSLANLEASLDTRGSNPMTERWKAHDESAENGAEFVRRLLPDVVDEVIFNLLEAFDNDLLDLHMQNASGLMRLGGSGELSTGNTYHVYGFVGDDCWHRRR